MFWNSQNAKFPHLASKQMLLVDIDVGPPEWCICGLDLNQSVHEGMKGISNVKVHLKTRSGNVNMRKWYISNNLTGYQPRVRQTCAFTLYCCSNRCSHKQGTNYSPIS